MKVKSILGSGMESRDLLLKSCLLIQKRTKGKLFRNTVQLGEFLLGWSNQYDKYSPSLTLRHPLYKEEWDFGENGTYLVMRQLEQHVKEFWDFMVMNTSKADGGEDIPAAIALASK